MSGLFSAAFLRRIGLEVYERSQVPPARVMDRRPNRPKVIQSVDVFVDAGGLIYATDYSAGLYGIRRLGLG